MKRDLAVEVLDRVASGYPVDRRRVMHALVATGDAAPPKRRRGIATPDDLKARSWIDPEDRNAYDPCWHYLGAKGTGGVPRIHTFDHDKGEKWVMSGPAAVWNIGQRKGTGDMLAYRKCSSPDCVNVGHVALAKDLAEIGLKIRERGNRKGIAIEARRASLAKAHAVTGHLPTPRAIVLACRAAPKTVSHSSLASLHGIAVQTVCRIRLGQSHKDVRAE